MENIVGIVVATKYYVDKSIFQFMVPKINDCLATKMLLKFELFED